MTQQLLIILHNVRVPVDDFLVNEQLQQLVVFGNELDLTNRVNSVNVIPLICSVRRQQNVNDDILQDLFELGIVSLDVRSVKQRAIVAANVKIVLIIQADRNLERVEVNFELLDLKAE